MLRLASRTTKSSRLPLTAMSKSRGLKSTPVAKSEAAPAGYAIDPQAPAMLRFQESLPRLPVPTLASTAEKYIESVRPHLSDVAFNKTKAAVNTFVESTQAADLQTRLQARADEPTMRSWLSEWWNDAAYMGYRDPVVVFVSYFFVHVDDKLRRDPVKRAASLLKAMLPFRELTETGQLEPDKVKGAPLCMSSNKWLFHSCRYPVKPSDTAGKFDQATHNHVVFLRKSKFYEVQLATPEGTELSAAELEVQIEAIIKLAGQDKGVPVGALTSDNRDKWAEAREALLAASPANAKTLERIESAAILVCLDDTKPVTREDISWQCWVGDGRNRFFDKQQLIVFDNGRSGFLGEHSMMDGTTTLRMNEFMLASLAAGKVNLGAPRTSSSGQNLSAPVELKFELNGQVTGLVKEAETRFDELVSAHDLHVLHYEGYGKSFMKQFKTSPDAWAQLVMQLAWQKMKGRPAVTYESAQTRKYQLGRTEVIRSSSNESKAWAEAMEDSNASDEHCAQLFRAAAKRHVTYASWAADGQGVDRHLFGLKKMLRKGESVPGIYSDEAFAKTSHWEFSTSQLSSPFFDGWGYGEVVPDGYGLAYAIGNDHIRWTITSLKLNTAELRHYLAEAATETRAMMERAAVAEKKHATADSAQKAKL